MDNSQVRIMKIIIAIILWWGGNTIVTITSKTAMLNLKHVKINHDTLSPSFLDFRWIELTMLQHLLGGIAALVPILLIKREYLAKMKSYITISKKEITLAALGNLIGNLATNAAYANLTSSSLQIIKGCEPLVTFALTLLLYRKYEILNIGVLISIVLICFGAGEFAVWNRNFNYWGLLAAILSNIAFPMRNIFLKRMTTSVDSPLVQYAVLSIYSSVILSPVLIIKLIVTGGFSLFRLDAGIISSIFHIVYNFASITILSMISPLSHSILNLMKRIFVVVINILYFSIPVTWSMVTGGVIFFIGALAFQYFHANKKVSSIKPKEKLPRKRLIAIFILTVVIAMFSSIVAYIMILSPIIPRNVNLNQSVVFDSSKTNFENGNHLKESNTRIMTMWLYNREIPEKIIKNIEFVHLSNPKREFYVYCGTQHCIHSLRSMATMKNASVEFIVISKLIRYSRFENWFAQHPYFKMLTGIEFEDHLTEVVKLALLSQYGGVYFDPTLKLVEGENISMCTDRWVSIAFQTSFNEKRGILDLSCFANNSHPLLDKLADDFVKNYPKIGINENSEWPIKYNFRKVIENSYSEYCNSTNQCYKTKVINAEILKTEILVDTEEINHYGTISYDSRVKNTNHVNLGDEIQNFPGTQFLPYVDVFMDRENQVLEAKGKTTLFMNAWWGDSRIKFETSNHIDPILTSMHIGAGLTGLSNNELDYFKHHEPIGARDTGTVKWFEEKGIETYLSNCLTLMIKNPNKNLPRTNNIYIVDVKHQYISQIPEKYRSKLIKIQHGFDNNLTLTNNRLLRFKQAYDLISLYSRAKLVITQRIHSALPCAAMGIPVLFINSADLPGGGGSNTVQSNRVGGLTTFFHTINLYSMSEENVKYFWENFNFENPPPNPNINILMKTRATFWNTIRHRQPIYDAAIKFGLLPVSSFDKTKESHLVFHYIFTDARELFTFGNSDRQWRYRRPIESIMYHHPFASVIIHSNTLVQSDFDVFTESGYNIKVLRYELIEMAKNTFFKELLPQYYSSEIENIILPFLTLYKWGGIFVNSDTFLTKSIEQFGENVLSFEHNLIVSSALMKFEKEHSYLEKCLNVLASEIKKSPESTDYNVNDIMTKVWRNWSAEYPNDTIEKAGLYTFQNQTSVESCFEQEIGEQLGILDSYTNSSIIHFKSSSAMYLNKQTSNGAKINNKTLCKFIVNHFCVLCNEVY